MHENTPQISTHDKLVTDEKLSKALDYYGRGTRNFYVKNYEQAADELGIACQLMEEIMSVDADELGPIFLLYGRALINLEFEGNVVNVKDANYDYDDDSDGGDDSDDKEEKTEQNDDDDDDEGEEEDEKIKNVNEKINDKVISLDKKENPTVNNSNDKKPVSSDSTSKSEDKNGTSNVSLPESKPGPSTSSGSRLNEKARAGPSTSNGITDGNDNDSEEDDGEEAGNFKVAWEVLELAVRIFLRQGDKSLSNLCCAYNELATISFENGNIPTALRDYGKVLALHEKMPIPPSRRVVSEIYFKIGLGNLTLHNFTEALEALKRSALELSIEIDELKGKGAADALTEEDRLIIKELEEVKIEVLEKIAEVEETKNISIDVVKKELSALIVGDTEASSSSSASTASTSTAGGSSSTAKPTNISHLIKRKKPDTPSELEENLFKKPTAPK